MNRDLSGIDDFIRGEVTEKIAPEKLRIPGEDHKENSKVDDNVIRPKKVEISRDSDR